MSTKLRKIFYGLSAGGTLVGLLAVTRSYMSGSLYPGNEEMYGKTVVITGANRGIGKETAKNLAKRGARVILACRDMKACDEARKEIVSNTFNKNVECMQCDLSSLASIKNFVNLLNQNEKHVDVLVNNAGVMWSPKKFTRDGFENHLGVNHLGHFYLTSLLVPKLVESRPSRVIVVACRDYQKGEINFDDLNSSTSYDESRAYNQSKLASVMFALDLNERVKSSGVSVTCVDPGYVYTDLMRNSSVYKSPYSPVSLFFKAFLKTPLMGAQSIVYACVREGERELGGKYIRDFQEVEVSPNALNIADRQRLWATSEKWTRLK